MNDLLFSSLITPVQIMTTQYLNQGDFFFYHLLFIFKIFIYIFIWLHRVLVVARGIFHCSTWTLVVVVCGVSCPVAYGILVPQPGIEPAFKVDS